MTSQSFATSEDDLEATCANCGAKLSMLIGPEEVIIYCPLCLEEERHDVIQKP